MTELFDMGGYEFYVWGSIGLALAVFAWNVLAPEIRRRAVIGQLLEAESEDAGESS